MIALVQVAVPDKAASGSTVRQAQSLFDGGLGVALAELEHAHRAGDTAGMRRAHHWITAATRTTVVADPSASGLHYGAPALAYVLHTAHQPAYAAALATLDTHIAAIIRYRLDAAHARMHRQRLPHLREFDLIRGLTGLGAYLLHRDKNRLLLRDVLAYLVALTQPVICAGRTWPGWWCPHGPADLPSPDWPGGHGNLGLAHGISGPLALLSTTARRGVTVAGQQAAIGRICTWLDRYRCTDDDQTWWPEMISARHHHDDTVPAQGPGRPSWCYGTPGLARAQQLAGIALRDTRRQLQAEHALASCLNDQRQVGQLSDPTLCHGWAGLLHTARHVAADALDPDQFALTAVAERLDTHLHRHGPPVKAGLLDGCAGVYLALPTTSSDRMTSTGWDDCLLLT